MRFLGPSSHVSLDSPSLPSLGRFRDSCELPPTEAVDGMGIGVDDKCGAGAGTGVVDGCSRGEGGMCGVHARAGDRLCGSGRGSVGVDGRELRMDGAGDGPREFRSGGPGAGAELGRPWLINELLSRRFCRMVLE